MKKNKLIIGGVFALVFAMGVCACGSKTTTETTENTTSEETVSEETSDENLTEAMDQAFISDLSTALVARWTLTDSKDFQDRRSELRGTGTTDEREMWRDIVDTELEVFNRTDYENASFDDEQLKVYALEYIQCLEESLDSTVSIISDYEQFENDWGTAYDKRLVLLKTFVDDYGLTVEEDFQANLDELITNAENLSSEESETSESGTSFKDGVYTCDEYTITITDYKVIAPGEEGNEYSDGPVIAFWYDVNNISDEDLSATSAWLWVFKAVQDNDPNMENKLNVGALPDSQYVDSQLATIKIGGTVSNAVAYELTDETTPVVLTACNLWGDEYGSQEFDITNK